MKKSIALLLVLLLAVSFSACQTGTAPATSAPAAETVMPEEAQKPVEQEAAAAPEEAKEEVLIGVEFFDWSIDLGMDIKNMIDYAAEALGCKTMYAENKFDSEQCITDVENLFAAGCKAVIVCNTNDAQMAKIVQVAEKYNGKVFQFFRTINDSEIAAQLMGSPAYGGQVHEDEAAVGYHVGMQMVEAGVKNVGLINFTVGDVTAEARQSGFVKAFQESGVNIVAETWEVTTGEVATQVTENYLASYPELDGIAVVGGSGEALFAVQNTLNAYGKTDSIVVSTVDFYSGMTDDLESGALGAIAGGHWCDPFFAYMLAYNYCTGALENGELPIEVKNNMIYIGSLEDSKMFDQWFAGDLPPFNADEIRALTLTYNPDFTVADLVKAAENLSLQDVIDRHGN